jgi:hypothetical protein
MPAIKKRGLSKVGNEFGTRKAKHGDGESSSSSSSNAPEQMNVDRGARLRWPNPVYPEWPAHS